MDVTSNFTYLFLEKPLFYKPMDDVHIKIWYYRLDVEKDLDWFLLVECL